MAEAPQQAHLPSHTPGEIDTHFESSPYDELAASRNGQQRSRFFDEYLITLVASEAVTAAGYKTRNPRQKGWELMRIPLVKAAIAQKMQKRMDRTKVTQDRVLTELAILGFSSPDRPRRARTSHGPSRSGRCSARRGTTGNPCRTGCLWRTAPSRPC